MTRWYRVGECSPKDGQVVVGARISEEWVDDDPDAAIFVFRKSLERDVFVLKTDGMSAENFDGGAIIYCDFIVTHWSPISFKL